MTDFLPSNCVPDTPHPFTVCVLSQQDRSCFHCTQGTQGGWCHQPLCLSTLYRMLHMTMTPRRRSSLLERTWESFAGFSDNAAEEQFIEHQIKQRKILLCGYNIINIARAIRDILLKSAAGTSSATYIFLQPAVPVNCLLLAVAFALGRWRWVEPLATAASVVRLIGEVMSLSPAFPSVEFDVWTFMISSISSCNLFVLVNVGGNFATHARFKVAFWFLVVHIALVPFIVAQSPAELSTLWLLLAQFSAVPMRLWDDMRSRAAFMKLHPAPAKASDNCWAYSEMSDEEFMELCRLATSSTYEPSVLSREHKVYLRIPGADPSDLGPDAEAKLKGKFEAQFPGYTVTGITFQRGSLLVGVKVSCAEKAESLSSADSTSQMLKGVTNSTWLSWLGLPTSMAMSGKVDIPTDRRVNWLDRFPLAASIRKSEQGFVTMSFPLQCSQSPQDVAFKASLGACVLECNVLVSPSDESGPNIGPGAKQSCVTLQVEVPADALCGSPCYMLTVNVQSLTDHVIIGDRTVVVLLDDLSDMEADLCSLRLLSHSVEAHGLTFDLQKQLYGAHIAYAVGCWLQTMNIERQRGGDGKEGGAMVLEQLDRMWTAGNRLVLHLVGNGCVAAAKHVVHMLLNSPALRPFVHQRMQREGSDFTGSFNDYFGGAINPRGSCMLHLAIKSGCCAMVDEVLRWTQAYQLPSLWVVQDRFGMTPLHLSVLINEGKMATFLLQRRCPVLLRAWHHNGGSAGSPDQFRKRVYRIPNAAGSMVDHHGHRRSGLRTLVRQRDLPTLRSSLQDPTLSSHAPTLPAVKTLAPKTAGVDPTDPGSDHFAHGQPLDGLPPKLSHADSVPAVSTNGPGFAIPLPRYRLMKQLWSSQEPWPNAEQQNKFLMYKMEKSFMIMTLACLLNVFGHVCFVLREGFSLLSLHAVLLPGIFTVPTIRAVFKSDYLAIEKLLLAWSLMRRLFVFHSLMTSVTPNYLILMLIMRLAQAAAQPIRFHWALAENLGILVSNCFLPSGISMRWIFLFHVLGLLITVVQQIRFQKQYLALEKSQ